MGLNKKIKKHLKNMPKYKINQEVFDTQNLARSRAFGRDRAIQTAQEDLEQDAANAASLAQDATTSTSGLLSTIASINANTTAGKRALAQDEATIQRDNVNDLYQANIMAGEEKDKEWRQNVLAPWEAKLKNMQQKKANRAQLASSITGGLLSAAGSFFGAGGFAPKQSGGGATNINAYNELPGMIS